MLHLKTDYWLKVLLQILFPLTDYSETEKQILAAHPLFWDALAKRDSDRRFSVFPDKVTPIGNWLYKRAMNNKGNPYL